MDTDPAKTPKPVPQAQQNTFAISAVAKLTGVSEHCLRIWERRYSVVEPTRTETRRRRYCQSDVERLVIIKPLVDSGDTISNVADLTLEQLRDRAQQLDASSVQLTSKPANPAVATVAAQTHDTATAAADPEFILHRYNIDQLVQLASCVFHHEVDETDSVELR